MPMLAKVRWPLAFAGLLSPLALARYINVINPASPYTKDIAPLLWVALVMSVVVFCGVAGTLFYVVHRFRARADTTGEPPQFRDNPKLETTLIIVPIILVGVLTFMTAATLAKVSAIPKGSLRVRVTAHQFFWDYRYLSSNVRNSNELVVPVNRPVEIELTSADVIHAFWVPSLGQQREAIPGSINKFTITAPKVGSYYGECNILCGAGHANMRFRVLAVPQSEYQTFIKEAKAYAAPQPKTAAEKRGYKLFMATCSACHRIQGTSANGRIGPDLSYFGSRTTMGAGVWPNKLKYLEPWIHDSPAVKPGSHMPPFTQLSAQQVRDLALYLESLKLPGLNFRSLPQI
jgi:cytochrome c oxidase subunit 2